MIDRHTVRPALLVFLAGFAFWTAAVACAEGKKARRKEAREKSEEKSETIWAPATVLKKVGAREPSGIAFHPGLRRLFVVGDEGGLAELDLEGAVVKADRIEAQIEDLAVHTPSGQLVLLSEARAELIFYDPQARAERKRWPIERAAALGEAADGTANQAFEGIAFRPDAKRPGGGVFYLAHQRAPAAVIGFAFDGTGSPRPLGATAVVSRWTVEDHEELTAITYVPALDRLVALARNPDRLVVLGWDGQVETRARVPGLQPEGLCFDDAGTLWIADDLGKALVRLPGALPILKARWSDKAQSR